MLYDQVAILLNKRKPMEASKLTLIYDNIPQEKITALAKELNMAYSTEGTSTVHGVNLGWSYNPTTYHLEVYVYNETFWIKYKDVKKKVEELLRS